MNGYADFPTSAVPFVPTIGQWTHIALSYDGATIKLYANGVLVGSGAKTGNITGDNVPFNVGGLVSCAVITAMHAFRRASIQPGQTAMVLGVGGVGLVLVQVLRAAGVRVLHSRGNED